MFLSHKHGKLVYLINEIPEMAFRKKTRIVNDDIIMYNIKAVISVRSMLHLYMRLTCVFFFKS